MRNLNLLFNKTYYDSLTPTDFPGVSDINNQIFGSCFDHDRDYARPAPMVSHSFLLTVCYPGLLVGIGNTHDAGMGDEEIGVGFSFDYVTGQPYIPGSTVKGILRNHFKDHPQVIAELCQKDLKWVRQLELDIFDYRDVFFDAVVYDGDPHGLLLGPEVITPHKSLTENPIPIKLLKILPDVRFSFRFRLADSTLMSKEEKESLFRQLLCLFGIGAKTNVGFGVLQEDETGGHISPKQPRAVPQPKPCAPSAPQRSMPPREQRSAPSREFRTNPSQTGSRPVNRIVCPHCGTLNYRCKPNSDEQWPSWPKCRNRDCRKDLL